MTEQPPTPELDKILRVRDKSQSIGEFVEWLSYEKGITLGITHVHDDGCKRPHEHGLCSWRCHKEFDITCGIIDGAILPVGFDINKLLAEFFGIDDKKAEQERMALLEHVRETNRA